MKTKPWGYLLTCTHVPWNIHGHPHIYRWTHIHAQMIFKIEPIQSSPCAKFSSNGCTHISRSHRRCLFLALSSSFNTDHCINVSVSHHYLSTTPQRSFEVKQHLKKKVQLDLFQLNPAVGLACFLHALCQPSLASGISWCPLSARPVTWWGAEIRTGSHGTIY